VSGTLAEQPLAGPRLLVLEGDSFERGVAHGRALGEVIQRRVRRLGPAIDDNRLGRLHAYAAQLAPDQMREVAGIAAGAGIDPREAFMLNAFEAMPDEPQPGCTALAVPDAGGAVVAQNWDGSEADAEELVVLRHVEPSGATTVLLASAGGLGWTGISSHGCALLSTDLICRGEPRGLPSQFLRRLMLAAPDVERALAELSSHPHPGGRTYVLGDRSGAAAVVEVAPRVEPHVRRLTQPAAHANHAEGTEIVAVEDADGLARTYPSSRHRERRAAKLLDGGEKPADVLGDHDGRPLSVCKHASEEEPSATVASVVYDLGRAEASIALGPPCTTPYSVHSIQGARGA
jgi:isopenicillin-N N-acyltransferase like protein